MPSEPESGPTMMSTLSCSTSFRVALTATSGFASDEALMISIFLPATMPLRCFTASSAPAHAVLAARREGPFQRGEQADLDHLLRVGDSRHGDDHRRDREHPHALPGE